MSRFEHRGQPGPQLVRRWKGLGYMWLQPQKLGCGHQAFLKIKQMTKTNAGLFQEDPGNHCSFSGIIC